MVERRVPGISVTPSSGNVFADLGFAEPEEELTKAELASHIRQVIKRRRLTQSAAAAIMGVDQPKVSALLNGRLANFSTDRLVRLLTALGTALVGLAFIGASGLGHSHRVPAGDWFIVNPGELASLQGVPIYGVCFSGHAPRAIVKNELRLPTGHPLRSSGGILIVHTLINAKGTIVKAQILKGPDGPKLHTAVTECLAKWRFEPAVDAHGKPAAVHFVVTLAVQRDH